MIKLIKKHKILSFALLAYLIVLLIEASQVLNALKASSYYLIEMIQILPAVFVLTALLQTWVPTSMIVKLFGQNSGIKGYLLSFLIGSLSAGPIYAAFPVCQTLLKKGANRKNVMVILSAWAVVKLPMLINEVKFMGASYMMTRWLITIVAIIIMSFILGWLVKAKDIVFSNEGVTINETSCILCKKCIKLYPDYFEMIDDEIKVKNNMILGPEQFSVCPVGAILS